LRAALFGFKIMSAVLRASIGGLFWAAFVFVQVISLQGEAWSHALLLFAALVLVPLGLELFEDAEGPESSKRFLKIAGNVQLPAGLFLGLACLLSPGPLAGLATLPWLGFTVLLAVVGFSRMKSGGLARELHLLCADVALMFLAIGGLWTLADRGGVAPLGFAPGIVALTAVHFHYAGLLLPLFAGLAQREMWMSRMASRAAVGVVLGVPAVAFGITATQLGWSPTIEAGAGCGLALAGMAVAVLHVRLALDARWSIPARLLLGVAGASLFFGMMLAALYAARAFSAPVSWLDLPQMRAVHGTVNALGFGLCGVLGWRLAPRA